jgi:hypothetical protein
MDQLAMIPPTVNVAASASAAVFPGRTVDVKWVGWMANLDGLTDDELRPGRLKNIAFLRLIVLGHAPPRPK